MREVHSIEEFLDAPVGTSVAGSHWLVWVHDPRLAGVAMWGRPGETSARELVRAWAHGSHPSMVLPFDLVTDGRGLEGIDPAAFQVVAGDLQHHLADYTGRWRRHALLHDGGLAASVMAGLLPILGASHSWQLFDDAAAAFAWLGRPEALPAVEAQRDAARLRGHVLHRLRERLWAQPGSTLEEVARALALSPRSLQRQLRALGSEFKREQTEMRLSLGQKLLDDGEKLETVAARLGYASASQFAVAFKRLTGKTPGEARRR